MMTLELSKIIKWNKSTLDIYYLDNPPFRWNDGFWSEWRATLNGKNLVIRFTEQANKCYIEYDKQMKWGGFIRANEIFFINKIPCMFYSDNPNESANRNTLFNTIFFAKVNII